MKLYQVRIRGGCSSTGTNYHESYVVASSIDSAYMQVREYLDRNDLCFKTRWGQGQRIPVSSEAGGAYPAVISFVQDPVNDCVIAFSFLAKFLESVSCFSL